MELLIKQFSSTSTDEVSESLFSLVFRVQDDGQSPAIQKHPYIQPINQTRKHRVKDNVMITICMELSTTREATRC
jgi:hypothetical protein